ncbi:hypothetical protein Tco_0592864 [Tanacetum coccineum]
MSAMADTTPVIVTVKNTGAKKKAPNETDAMPRANILNFCEEHYDDILPIIMDRIRRDKRKEGRNDDKSVFNRLSHRKKSAFKRLSDTYSPSTTKSGLSRASSRNHSQGKNRLRVKDLLRGIEESYGDTQSSRGTKTKYKDRSYKEDHSRRTKKGGKVSPRPLAYQQAIPAMEDARNQGEKGTGLHMKTLPYPGLARM